eukprot:CAMPEP_0201958052 /NCGR_PEP_ID=MMETSP0904-20121228/5319_1 /ASSEMBLY_ACC=CAM_ASM_000553 /TAXON_ID=420261 /ORGANISM="Thalassiosira antarctica, Strain CCMP982" /LENGTH=170 /DNA_ID=CAMNT_0048503301 /DNA_START=869 /DNA_END=1379 /DNA_ORIENTATION=-
MKFPLHLLLSSSSSPLSASGYLPSTSTPALLRHSSHRRRRSPSHSHYKEPSSSDIISVSGSSSSSSSGDASNIWSVLANTERWISDTLDRSSNKAANARLDAEELKLKKKRKKRRNCTLPMEAEEGATKGLTVSEEGGNVCVRGGWGFGGGAVGGVFRGVREARELGESH